MKFNFSTEARKGYLILLAVFVLSLSVRIWLLDKRWITPDEGAHLMDAVLALDGKIPEIDFASRQPFYVYANGDLVAKSGTFSGDLSAFFATYYLSV